MSNDRVVLNANEGQNNLIGFDEFAIVAERTLLEISETIMPLCGPDALYDLVIYERIHTGLMSNVFSNDGIHILKSFEYMSPIQSFITSYIKYIAEKVELAAADGTSTAIVLSTAIIRHALTVVQKLREDTSDKSRMRNISEFRDIVTDLLIHLRRSMAECKIDIGSEDIELKKKLIYQLAMTSSKSNKVLSDFTVEVFSELPELLYEQTNSKRSTFETSTPLSVEYPESDIIININPSSSVRYNAKLNTEWIDDDCDLLPVVSVLDTTQADNLVGYINTVYSTRSEKRLVLLLSGADEAGMVRLERNVDKDRVVICRMNYFHPLFINNPTELRVILAMAGKATDEPRELIDFDAALIHSVKARISGRCMYIDNIIPKTGSDSKIHPYYNVAGTHAPYDKLRMELETKLRELKTSHNSKEAKYEIDEFSRIYRLMVCSKLPILVIGGTTVEHLALVNVVADVLGVVSIAMKHGVILDMMPKLTLPFSTLIVQNKAHTEFFRNIRTAIIDFTHLTYSDSNDIVGAISTFTNGVKDRYYDKTWKSFTNANDNINVVQSAKAIDETFKRLIETVPKLISVDKIIVPNSVMRREESNANFRSDQ